MGKNVDPVSRHHRALGFAAVAIVFVLTATALGSLGVVATPATSYGNPSTSPTAATSPSPASSSGTVIFQGQTTSVTEATPSSGTSPYSWQWLYSTDEGQSFRPATSSQCALPKGSGATAGTIETCAFATTASTVAGTYLFELKVTDSATVPESVTSVASSSITVKAASSPVPARYSGPPVLDTEPAGSCTGGCTTTDWFGGAGGSGPLTLTTASSNELLVLEITDSGESGPGLSTADVTDTQGSPWSLASSHAWNGAGNNQFLFYAIDPTAGTDTVTVDTAAGSLTSAVTATAILSAFFGVDTGAPIGQLGTFSTGTGTSSSGSVTTTVAPTTILGVLSTGSGASGFSSTTTPAFAVAGTANDGIATASFLEYYGTRSTGTYTSSPTWTGSAAWGEEAVAIQGTSPLSVTVSPTSTVIDQDQSATITAAAMGGTGSLSYSWSVQSGSCPGFSDSGAATLVYQPTGTTATCVLTVTVTDANADTAQPATPASVVVNSPLAAPSSPSVSVTALDENQILTVTGTIPSTGTPTYSWQWLVSANSGSYATVTHCLTSSGTGASGGALETCSIPAYTLIVGYTYTYELKVTDSASTPETATSPASSAVKVSSALTVPAAPTPSSTKLDFNEALTVTGTIPAAGTSPYSWQWTVSVNSGAYGTASQCGTSSGTGATGGSVETCSIPASTLTVGDNYAFKFQVTDSATVAESQTSVATTAVAVSSTLTAPAAPTPSLTSLSASQALSVTGTIPSTGTPPYSWQWLVQVNGTGGFVPATQCTVNSGIGASVDAPESCIIAAGTLFVGATYSFELEVTDTASTPESQTSSASSLVTVASALSAPAPPTPSAILLDADQVLTVTGTIPTNGTSTYSWQWWISVNGATYQVATECGSSASGSGATGGVQVTCTVPANTLTAGSNYAFELQVTDSASNPETQSSSPSSTVTTSSALAAGTPTPTAPVIDSGQSIALTARPSGGAFPYSYQWYQGTSAAVCTALGSPIGGATQSTYLASPTSTTFYCYVVTDSSSVKATSGTAKVTVDSALTPPLAPTVSATALDFDQSLMVTGTIPSSGTFPYSWEWFVSINGTGYVAATQCALNEGSGAGAGTSVYCTIAASTLFVGGKYAFQLQVTDSAHSPEVESSPSSPIVTIASELTPPGAPTPSATYLDADQALTVTGIIPSNGTALYSWQWLISINGASYADATQCGSSASGTGATAGATETCTIPGNTLVASTYYAFELEVADSASTPEVAASLPSATVTTSSALTAGDPTSSASILDRGQSATLTANPTGGSGGDTFQWYWGSTSTVCISLVNQITGGNQSTYLASPTSTTYYCYVVMDSLSATATSTAVELVVNPALVAPPTPTVSATKLDVDQTLTVTGTIPSTGTSPYAWQWLISVGGGSFVPVTRCGQNSGIKAAAGDHETCTIAGGTLASSATYAFQLEVTDSAPTPETNISLASATVTVSSTLTAPAAPTVSATALDVDQALTVTGTIPSTGTPTYSWQWLVSMDDSAYAAATQCTASSGSGASGGATETCTIPGGTLTAGATYSFELQVTDRANSTESIPSAASPVVSVRSALTTPPIPSVSATALDVNQPLMITGTIPSTGTSSYSWDWLVSVSGGAYGPATLCAVHSGSDATGGTQVTCAVAAGTLTTATYYSFELEVTDSATSTETATSLPSATVSVSSALTAPFAPTVSATAMDVNQALTVTGIIPSTGTSLYSWQWKVSVDGGVYGNAHQCAISSGTGATEGSVTTCSVPASTLTAGDTYSFKLQVTDSATAAESQTSAASSTVTVSSTLTAPVAPSVSATALDRDQVLHVTGTIPSTGTATYSWKWLVSIDSAGYVAATQCAQNSGPTAAAGVQEICVVQGGTLTAGDTYAWELQVTDSASSPETSTSPASSTVMVSSALTAPAAPSVSATELDVNQALSATAILPSTGTAPYSWQWMVSVNGTGYATADHCGTPSGTGASAGASEKCVIAANTLYVGATYSFELQATDSASTPETQTSLPSPAVTVNSILAAPGAPTLSATALDADQALTVTGSIPATGTATYSWQWLVSVNGGSYTNASQCAPANGSSAHAGDVETCSMASGTLTAGSSYTFELKVVDSATSPATVTSPASASVAVSEALAAPLAPVVSATELDVDQVLDVTGTIPSTGTATYSWEWLMSVAGGTYTSATVCAMSAGTGASAGASETCAIAANALNTGTSYAFELEVEDSSGMGPETRTSSPSLTVNVRSALTAPSAPTLSASTLGLELTLTVTGTIPSTGTPTYSWQWLVSMDDSAYAAATQCTASSGSGASGGATETCTIPGGTLTAGATYSFELQVTDRASTTETATSAASATVIVVGPAVVTTTAQGPVGAAYTITGSGFGASAAVTVSFGGNLQAPIGCSVGSYSGTTITANASGEFACTFTVPSEIAGVYPVVGTDVTANLRTLPQNFTVTTPMISVSPAQGTVGSLITVSGTGFSVSTPLTSLIFDSQSIASCTSGSLTTNRTGAFSCTFAVPSGTSGTTVTVIDSGGQASSTTFTVTTSAASASFPWMWVIVGVVAVLVAVLLAILMVTRRRRAAPRNVSPARPPPAEEAPDIVPGPTAAPIPPPTPQPTVAPAPSVPRPPRPAPKPRTEEPPGPAFDIDALAAALANVPVVKEEQLPLDFYEPRPRPRPAPPPPAQAPPRPLAPPPATTPYRPSASTTETIPSRIGVPLPKPAPLLAPSPPLQPTPARVPETSAVPTPPAATGPAIEPAPTPTVPPLAPPPVVSVSRAPSESAPPPVVTPSAEPPPVPVTVRPVETAPSPPAPPATEPTPPRTEVPPAESEPSEPGEPDLDSVLAELDAISGEILTPPPKKSPEPKAEEKTQENPEQGSGQ